MGIDLLALPIVIATLWEWITKVIIASESIRASESTTLSGVQLVVELITIADITDICGFNSHSILSSSASCLLLFHWIFSESNFFGNTNVTLDLEVTVLVSRGATLSVSFLCSSHSRLFIAIQLNIWLKVEPLSSAQFDITAWDGSPTEKRICSNCWSANHWDKGTSQVIYSAATSSSEATNSEARIIKSISSVAASSETAITWWRSRARWRKISSS
jgi:hypothetical protein